MMPPESTPFIPIAASTADATPFDCPLCGARFSHGTLVCGSCPMNAGCEIVKCPSCGYQFPRRSLVLDFAKRLFGGRSGA
ncbi:MAG TPA: hypothetical protein VFV19_12930 [Candidatus Polarisedimenticolaceae bacterium]|nr:hypothetical protein [Candidatus Polarisedimenticolaceae bacterium]